MRRHDRLQLLFRGTGDRSGRGRPMFLRRPDSHLGLANFMRSHLYASLATLKIGLDILLKEEDVKIDSITGHGGLFKTKGVGQSILAAAMNAPISVMETAGEGRRLGHGASGGIHAFQKKTDRAWGLSGQPGIC